MLERRETLVVREYLSDGGIVIDHRRAGLYQAEYIGYETAKHGNSIKLYPRAGVRHRDVRFAGKTVSIFDLTFDLREREPAPAPEPEKKTTKKEEPRAAEFTQLCFKF